MWSDCSNFIDHSMNAVNPKSAENTSSDVDSWDNKAAFACLDKFLFSEKMSCAFVVENLTISELEGRLEQFATDDVLAEPSIDGQHLSSSMRKRYHPIGAASIPHPFPGIERAI